MKPTTRAAVLPLAALALALLAPACDSDDGGGGTADVVEDTAPADTAQDTFVLPDCAKRDPLEPYQIEVLVDGESVFGVPVPGAEARFEGVATVTAAPSGPVGVTTLTLQDAGATEITLTTNLPGGETLLAQASDEVEVSVVITDDFARDLRVTVRDDAGELLLDAYDGRLRDTPVLDTCGPVPFDCGAAFLATVAVPVDSPALAAGTVAELSEAEATVVSSASRSWSVFLPTARKHEDVVCPDTPSGYLVWAVIQSTD